MSVCTAVVLFVVCRMYRCQGCRCRCCCRRWSLSFFESRSRSKSGEKQKRGHQRGQRASTDGEPPRKTNKHVPVVVVVCLMSVGRSVGLSFCRNKVPNSNDTWLILPVVICLSQSLSHASVSSRHALERAKPRMAQEPDLILGTVFLLGGDG